jgi:hypothetical protein
VSGCRNMASCLDVSRTIGWLHGGSTAGPRLTLPKLVVLYRTTAAIPYQPSKLSACDMTVDFRPHEYVLVIPDVGFEFNIGSYYISTWELGISTTYCVVSSAGKWGQSGYTVDSQPNRVLVIPRKRGEGAIK